MFKELNILKIFFESPTREFNVRDIARMTKIAPATASTKLKMFAKRTILKERKERNFIFYKAKLDSDYYKDLKIFYTIRKVRKCELIEKLNHIYIKPTLILFGSASHGLDTEDSDIDLLVISENKKEFKEKNKFEKKLNRKLQLFIVKDIKELKNKHLINNILNGISLQGTAKLN